MPPQNQTRALPQSAPQQYNPGPPQHPQLAGLEAAPIPRQKQFWIDFRSKMDGQQYQGQFTTKKLSVKDLAQIGVRKAQLNGGFYHDEDRPGCGVDPQTDWINSMIAQLEVALVQAPIWWNISEIIDGELLAEVFKAVMEFENSFFRFSGTEAVANGSGPNASGPAGQGAGVIGSAQAVGGREVQAALEP